jgi:hypothetical protein
MYPLATVFTRWKHGDSLPLVERDRGELRVVEGSDGEHGRHLL